MPRSCRPSWRGCPETCQSSLPSQPPALRACRCSRRSNSAGSQGIEVDARVARGRTYRDALRRLLEEEQFDRIIVSATDSPRTGLSGGEVEWLLDRVPAQVMIPRPAPDDTRLLSADGSHEHF